MLRNYLQVAFSVLSRNKFFTCISLFGISFTLLILMLIAGYLQAELGDAPPLGNKDKILLLSQLRLEYVRTDTTLTLDTVYQDGQMRVDTTKAIGAPYNEMVNQSAFSREFLEKHLLDLPEVEQYAFYSPWHRFDLYVNGGKIPIEAIYADPAFWEIFDFRLLEGRFWGASDQVQAAPVAVITDELARQYFGQEHGAAGKEMELDGKAFTVVGVVAKATASFDPVTVQAYLPSALFQEPRNSHVEYMGQHMAVFMGKNLAQMKRSLEHRAAQIPMPNSDFNVLRLIAASHAEAMAWKIIYDPDPAKSKRIAVSILIGLIGLFTLLPALNLVNLNTSRLLERSGEIGVRKAFGAHSGHILLQFVVENVVLTLIGGLIALLLAIPLARVLNASKVLGPTALALDFRFWLYGLLIALLFGVLTGLLPAWRMSRAYIVESLKHQ